MRSVITLTDDHPAAGLVALRWWTGLSIAAMLMWFCVTNHLDLSPLNDLDAQGGQLASTLSGLIPFGQALLTIAFAPPLWLLIFWTGYSYVWLALQALRWWVAYLMGGDADHWDGYTRTLHVLPQIDGRMGPDLKHLILQFFSLLMAIALTVPTMQIWRRARAARLARQSRTSVA